MSEKEHQQETIRWKYRNLVLNIFKPHGGFSGDSILVGDMIRLGLVTYTVERIILERPANYVRPTTGPGKESIGHLVLKRVAGLLLKELRENNPLFEYCYWDVYSPKLEIRVECGGTDPKRLMNTFRIDDLKQFWVLQYPKRTEDFTFLFKFIPSDKNSIKNYYEQLAEINMIEMKIAMGGPITNEEKQKLKEL